MAANPRSITKFRALSRLDQWSGDDAARQAVYDAALARLDDPNFEILGKTVAGVEDIANDGAPDPLNHLREHWLNNSYFPSVDPVTIRATLRDGFRDAITDARQANLPLNSIWVRGSHDSEHDDFRVDHVVGATSVTVAIITPAPATRSNGPRR